MLTKKRTITAKCPGCSCNILFYREPKLGEFVTCPECREMVEVMILSPLTQDWYAEEEECPEWDDDIYDYSDRERLIEGYDD